MLCSCYIYFIKLSKKYGQYSVLLVLLVINNNTSMHFLKQIAKNMQKIDIHYKTHAPVTN